MVRVRKVLFDYAALLLLEVLEQFKKWSVLVHTLNEELAVQMK